MKTKKNIFALFQILNFATIHFYFKKIYFSNFLISIYFILNILLLLYYPKKRFKFLFMSSALLRSVLLIHLSTIYPNILLFSPIIFIDILIFFSKNCYVFFVFILFLKGSFFSKLLSNNILFFKDFFQLNIVFAKQSIIIFFIISFFLIREYFFIFEINQLKNKINDLDEELLLAHTENTTLKDKLIKQNTSIKKYINFSIQNTDNIFSDFSIYLNKEFGKNLIDSICFSIDNSDSISVFSNKNIINPNKFYERLSLNHKNLLDLQFDNSLILKDASAIKELCHKSFCNIILIFTIHTETDKLIFSLFFSIDSLKRDILLQQIDSSRNILKAKIFQNETLKKKSKTIESLYKKAYLDSLTGIYRREKYEDYIENIFKIKEKNVALIMFDLDKFKNINDTYGHVTGDIVIKRMGKTIKKHIRKNNDLAIRYGGEEFLAIIESPLTENIKKIAYNIAEKIRIDMETHIFISNSKKKFIVTVSSGIYFNQNNKEAFSDFYEKADMALYKAKESGRNQVVIWENFNNERNEY